MPEYCTDPEAPCRPRCCRRPGEAGARPPTRGPSPPERGSSTAPGRRQPRGGPTAGKQRCAGRVGPHLPVLRQGHVRHGLASVPVPGHLGDRACHVCKAKHTRDEARPGRGTEGVPVRALTASAGPALTSGQAHSVRAGHGLPVGEQLSLPLRVVLVVAAVPVGLLAQPLQVLQRDPRHRVRRARAGDRPGAAQRGPARRRAPPGAPADRAIPRRQAAPAPAPPAPSPSGRAAVASRVGFI